MSGPNWIESFGKEAPAASGSDGSTNTTSPTAPTPNSGEVPKLESKTEAPAPLGDALNTNTPKADGQPSGDGQTTSKETAKAGDKPGDAQALEFKLPDGLSIAPEHHAALTEFQKQHNLPPEALQRVVDLGAEVAQQTRSMIEQDAARESEAMRAEWKQALLADPELGGPKLPQTQANFNAFQQSKLAEPALLQLLNETGLLTHPSIARLISRIGASMRENPVNFGAEAPNNRRPENELYARSAHN